ncbi:phosphatase PAP2 family protein [Pseudoduganella namucuonensis]|nr:phosphatase PAP2 family protein [Pseudoduganella namucuonensis]
MLAALTASALLILWIGAYTDLDLRLANAMYDARAHTFPWRHAWLTEQFGHGLLKSALTALAAIAILLCAGEQLLRKRYPRPWWRLRLRLLAACAMLIPTATSLLKQASKSHCPWDLERFGGSQQYYRLLEHVPAWVEAGKCLPGGHASTALWLVGVGVFWLPHRPRTALAASGASVAFGAAVGWLQQMRGAHFLTHTLWSVWIACAIAAGLLWLQSLRSRRALQPDGQRRIYGQHDHDAAEHLLP